MPGQTGIKKVTRVYVGGELVHAGRMNLRHTPKLREVALCKVLEVSGMDVVRVIIPRVI